MPGPMRHGSMTLFAALNPQRVGAARADAPSIPSRATSTSRRAAAARACGAAAAVSAAAAGIRITFAAGWRHSVGSPVQPVRRPRLVIVRPACHGAVVAAVPGVLVADPLIAVGRCIGRWGRRCRIVGGRTGRDGAETQSEYGRESEFALHVQFSLGKRATGPGLVAYRVPVRGRRRGQRRPGGCWRHGLGDERALCSPRKIYLRWLVKISRSGRECCPGDPAVASRWVIAPPLSRFTANWRLTPGVTSATTRLGASTRRRHGSSAGLWTDRSQPALRPAGSHFVHPCGLALDTDAL